MNFMDKVKSDVNEWFTEYFNDKGNYNKILYKAMEYSIKIGGKRIRPILMMASYNIYKPCYKSILPIACGVEMIHTYSLIHDDLPCMDNDDLRRGKPTNHKVFGDAVALLAGDGLLNEAINIMFDACLKGDIKTLKACQLISKAAGAEGMIGGQIVDIISQDKPIEEKELYYMHSHKTGKLIKSSIVAGAILADAKEKDIQILDEYGEKLGLAFQIRDDILDIIGDKKILGKNIHSDDTNNKVTFVSTFGIEKCKSMCEDLTSRCLELIRGIDGNIKYLEDITLFLLNREF